MNNICAETMVPTMPFLFKSKDHMREVLDGPIGDQILKACEPQGYVGLAFYDSGSRRSTRPRSRSRRWRTSRA